MPRAEGEHLFIENLRLLAGDRVPRIIDGGASRSASAARTRTGMATVASLRCSWRTGSRTFEAGLDWLQGHLDYTTRPLLSEPWILDIDTTVKPLYGHQEG
jgi:hypothetical protein